MHTHRVDILDRAHDHDVVAAVAHQFEFVFLPSEDGLFDQHVRGRRRGETTTGDTFEVSRVVRHAGAETTHRERRAHDDRVTEFGDRVVGLVHRVADPRARGLPADLGDDVLELLPVLAALDGIEVGADQFDIVLVEDALLGQRDRGVERGLPAEGGEHGVDRGAVRGFGREDLLDEFGGDRLDVGGVGELRVGHDRRGVRVDEGDPQALLAQHPACLGAGVVELAGLTDDDRARSDDQDVGEIGTAWHQFFSPSSMRVKRSNR